MSDKKSVFPALNAWGSGDNLTETRIPATNSKNDCYLQLKKGVIGSNGQTSPHIEPKNMEKYTRE